MTARIPVPHALGALAAGCVLAGLVLAFLVTPVRVSGTSMRPMLEPGDVLLVVRWPRRITRVRPGDVVVADILPAAGGARRLIKRVVGVERVGGEIRVRLRGDNPPESADSRVFGPVGLECLRGVAVWRIYPRFGPLPPAGSGMPEAPVGSRAARPAGR